MSRFESFDAIDKHYNIRSLYESGRNRKDMNKDDKDRLKDLVDSFVKENYMFDKKTQENNMKNKLKYKITESSCPTSQSGSHIYNEFKHYCEAQRWYGRYNLAREGEDSTKFERSHLRQVELENCEMKKQIKDLQKQLEECSFKDNSQNIIIEKKEDSKTQGNNVEELSLKEQIKSVKDNSPKKKRIPPQAVLPDEFLIDSDSDEEVEVEVHHFLIDSDEEVEVKENKSFQDSLYNESMLGDINWESIEPEQREKFLRDACNQYAFMLRDDYQKDKDEKGDDAIMQYELLMKFEEWFSKQYFNNGSSDIIISPEVAKQIENKFVAQIEVSLEFISPY
tara:strand:+ start:1805 stop:2815 length:1011 start_codon:yes stop_codon:yes gene_type:complete